MGEAEDVVLGRMAAEDAARDAERERIRVRCIAEIKSLLPRMQIVLRVRNYEISAVAAVYVLNIQGVKRVGWGVSAGPEMEYSNLYVLADGTFASQSFHHAPTIVEADQLDWSWAPYALDTVKRIVALL